MRVGAIENRPQRPYVSIEPKGAALTDDPKKLRADTEFRKLQRAEDGKKAMSEYEAQAVAEKAKTERLRAARLAREAEQNAAAPTVTTSVRSTKKGGKASKQSAAKLSDWLKDQQDSGRNN